MHNSILITGSSGFVGKSLVNYFRHKNVEFTKVNLRQSHWSHEVKQSSFTTYIHLAGIAHDLNNKNGDQVYYEVNYELTKKLFDCFLEDKQSELFIFFSSIKAASDQPKSIVTEETEPSPKTVYGKSKLLAENYILKNLPPNKKVIILRPAMIHGPGNKGNLNLLIKLIKLNIPWCFGDFENKRSYSSIENVCYIIEKILSKEIQKSGVYNISDDNSISTNELIRLAANTLGKHPKIIKVPKFMIISISHLGDLIKLPLNSQVLNKIIGTYEVSNHKIKNELGIKNLPISTEKGLINTIKSYEND
jgi:nucleoside-diphosphate-sugar epimerase